MTSIGAVLARNLKALRAEKGWNQGVLAERSGFSLEQVKRIETDASWVSKDAVAALALALDVPESRLFLDPDLIPSPTIQDALRVIADTVGVPIEFPNPKR